MWPAGFGDEMNRSAYAASRIEYHNDQSRIAPSASFPKPPNGWRLKRSAVAVPSKGPFNWAGVVDQYFAAVFIPGDQQNAAFVTLRNSIDVPKDERNPNAQETSTVEVLGAALGHLGSPTSERIFVGPKSLQVLESVHIAGAEGHTDLRDLVNFGFFGPIARVLFIWLRWIYEHMVPNWGWAIVVQTFIITVALLPLRASPA